MHFSPIKPGWRRVISCFMFALFAEQIFALYSALDTFSACLQLLPASAVPPCQEAGKCSFFPVARSAALCNALKSSPLAFGKWNRVGTGQCLYLVRYCLQTTRTFACFILLAWDGRRCLPRSTKGMFGYYYFSEPEKASVYSGPTLLSLHSLGEAMP